MTVNVFSLEMAEVYLKGAEPSKHLIYSNEALDSYYKLFTTGFETEASVINCVERDDKFVALLDVPAFVVTPGCIVKTDKQSRVLKIGKQDNKCELILDAQIAPGKLTVCGLGFIAVSKDETARTFTVRDSVFGNEMVFKLNFRDSETAIKKNEALVEVTVLGSTVRLLHQYAFNNGTDVTQTNEAQLKSWRSFISNGSWLWYSAKATDSTSNLMRLKDLENLFCGWISRTEFVVPAAYYLNISGCIIAGCSGVVGGSYYSDRIYIFTDSKDKQETTPLLVKPWAIGTFYGNGDNWAPNVSTRVESLGSGYLLLDDKMVKIPGIQYAPIVSYYPFANVFEYGDKLIYTSDAAYRNIPHYFSLDDKDWVQDE